uniref:L antigen family member 3 n=1 Tax=Oryctolagus cuniculus TaxID=9986 RepID=A0A5F9DK38_RABIT
MHAPDRGSDDAGDAGGREWASSWTGPEAAGPAEGAGAPPAEGCRRPRLSASFVSATEAEVALRCLAPGARPFRGAVRRALTVIGSQLLVRIAAENSGLLQISIASLFNQLSLVAQAMQRFVPPGTSHRGTRVWGPILSLALG